MKKAKKVQESKEQIQQKRLKVQTQNLFRL